MEVADRLKNYWERAWLFEIKTDGRFPLAAARALPTLPPVSSTVLAALASPPVSNYNISSPFLIFKVRISISSLHPSQSLFFSFCFHQFIVLYRYLPTYSNTLIG
jgi:hypothetical protein